MKVASEPGKLVDETDYGAGLGSDEAAALGEIGVVGLQHVDRRGDERHVLRGPSCAEASRDTRDGPGEGLGRPKCIITR